MAFVKGTSGNPTGRKPGVPDRISQEVRDLTRQLFDKAYWTRTRTKLLEGSLAPMIEAKLLAYAYGEPKHEHAAAGMTVLIGFLGAQQHTAIDVTIEPQHTLTAETCEVLTLQPAVAERGLPDC